MSAKTELIYKICTEAFVVIAMPVTFFFIRQTKDYKAEVENDPKAAKRNMITGIGIWGSCLISLIVNLLSK